MKILWIKGKKNNNCICILNRCKLPTIALINNKNDN